MNSSILKSLLSLIFLILCTTLCAQTFYESFDGCEGVGGNDGYWNKSTVAGNVVTDKTDLRSKYLLIYVQFILRFLADK